MRSGPDARASARLAQAGLWGLVAGSALVIGAAVAWLGSQDQQPSEDQAAGSTAVIAVGAGTR